MQVTRILPHAPGLVWAALQDFGSMAGWCADLSASAQVEGDGLEVGAVRELLFAKPAGSITGVRERITAVGDHWFEYVLDGGVGVYPEAGSRWALEAAGDGTRITVESYVRGGPLLGRLLMPLTRRHLRAGLERAFDGLDAYLESSAENSSHKS